MSAKAVRAIILTLTGCMLNNIFLEYIIQLDPGAGHLITLCQFLFIAIHGYIFTSKFGTVTPKIPLKDYVKLVVFFFTTSVMNNWAFAFNIPVPLHMIFRAGSLIANMIMGIIILKKKYTIEKYFSVFCITFGIIICTLYSSKSQPSTCTDCDPYTKKDTVQENIDYEHFFWWLIGIIILTVALLMSAGMGIFQEQLYKKHGKQNEEALYYTHLYPLPGFLMYYGSIVEHVNIASSSEMVNIPLLNMGFPILWIFLISNVVTQFLCISNVYVLTAECASLTVTLVITLRKFFSLVFSIIYFQNPFTAAHWFGTALVFIGTLMFSETHYIILDAFSSKSKESLKHKKESLKQKKSK
ncbi:unnamed protein product [Psylliodes chrysocephalus]|uniref:UDP-xylose and UDP-N-acetylglucosamine transporter n=1 Tax=Psylliodes chrysocephalus TaxID=3402493 RepID=A0A9P0GB81_9CUCU|nr:unnamed protein product [Psylliodes chrysocephala]